MLMKERPVSKNWTPSYCCRPTESRFDGSSRKRDTNRLVAIWCFLCVLILAFNDNLLRWTFGVWLKLPWRCTPAGSQTTLWPWSHLAEPQILLCSTRPTLKQTATQNSSSYEKHITTTSEVLVCTPRKDSLTRKKTKAVQKLTLSIKVERNERSLSRNLFFLRVKDTGKVAACSPATYWPLKAVYHISATRRFIHAVNGLSQLEPRARTL